MDKIVCRKCSKENDGNRYFCSACGSLLSAPDFVSDNKVQLAEMKIKRILENLNYTPHSPVIWNDYVDRYVKKVEKFQALYELPEMGADKNSLLSEDMMKFLDFCTKPEFQIAFVGTIKTGKSTLINSLLGRNYASMDVTPETAALTKFRSSPRDYVRVTFYNKKEWEKLWDSRTSGADMFMKEYQELRAEEVRDKWVGHEVIYKEIPNQDIEKELITWSSSRKPEHYFVKEVEVGISTLPKSFSKQVVLVDTPGLSDPVAYRSEITRGYIKRANAVFVCVDAQKIQKEEIETISSVFSFSQHNKSKVYIVATHWDKLNNPDKQWKKQSRYLANQLTGPGFFDNVEMASSNILYSAAYIYNLCRDFEDLSVEDKRSLMQFVVGMSKKLELSESDMMLWMHFGMGKRSDFAKLKGQLPLIKKLTNINRINREVTQKLAGNYQDLLYQDIEKLYKKITYDLKRICGENQDDVKKILDLMDADEKELQARIEEHKRNYDKVSACKEQLEGVLNMIQKRTQQRLVNVLSISKK